MTEPQFFDTPGYGPGQLEKFHYHQAVRVGNRVDTSGQGGWRDDFTFPDSLEDEIVQAFDNVERTLAEAGATWRDVIIVDSLHVPQEEGGTQIGELPNRVVVEQFTRRMGDRAPLWTAFGVKALGDPRMRVEIRVTAVVRDDL